MSRADKWTRGVTVAVVVAVALVAGYVSYRHIFTLIITHGEDRATAYAGPVTVDGPMLAASLVLLDAARRGQSAHWTAWGILGSGILASMAANIAHGLTHGLVGAVVSGWPAYALAASVELLWRLMRGYAPVEQVRAPVEQVRALDPVLAAQAVELFGESETVPSQRTIRDRMRLGQQKARQVQDYLSTLPRPSAALEAA